MPNSAAISNMQNAIINYLRRKTAASKSTTQSSTNSDSTVAVQGIISGNNVIIGNKSYPCEPVVDVNYRDGDYVWCLIASGNQAIIVGK